MSEWIPISQQLPAGTCDVRITVVWNDIRIVDDATFVLQDEDGDPVFFGSTEIYEPTKVLAWRPQDLPWDG